LPVKLLTPESGDVNKKINNDLILADLIKKVNYNFIDALSITAVEGRGLRDRVPAFGHD
jgi:hypothetical protein